ncbi:prolipoprotein diacylglyceryl transferase [bacterium]|nr:prolipoprotein diacylglyceryl transferase [bacterium]
MIILSSPGAVAFNIGAFPVYYYGICIAIAALIGFWVSYGVIKNYYKDLRSDILFDVVTVAILSGIIFARLYYCALNFDYYQNHFFEIFNIRQGGLAIQGGIFGGFIVTSLYCYFKKYPILKLADICSYGLITAQAIGRWGNFFNSEAYGFPSKHFIAVFIPENLRISGYEFYKYFHPTFLYESLLNILVLLILFFVVRKAVKNIDGLVFAYYLFLYSLVRFFVEALRIDCIVNVGALHAPQLVSLVTIFFAILFISYKRIKNKN